MSNYRDEPEPAQPPPNARLLFWLKVPYAADVVLVIIGVAFLLADNGVGWWVLVFAAVRAAVGTIALFWLYPRLTGRRKQ
ncbi:hypothetical protein SAMN04489806_1449 [Paramicrobacterium humi]|uniref:Uncharacterized protein n=1 Tax=Paramicrobacterium humi TaxID=640635 RepID=A0A1H4L7F1_9MICO|nr:hypothetical protein [Microbacterium humi]SEB66674.1 hypothetical protein SAMN04489806_1449 [Microbacterium humi]